MASHTDVSVPVVPVADVHHVPAPGAKAELTMEDGSERYQVHWFRGTIFQILVVGGVFFCAPGMYNALSGLGGKEFLVMVVFQELIPGMIHDSGRLGNSMVRERYRCGGIWCVSMVAIS